MKVPDKLLSTARATKTFVGDVAEGFFQTTHNGFALLGLTVAIGVATLAYKPELRHEGEERLTAWLTERKVAAMGITPELGAIERATAANPSDLPREQANVALWIARKYRVAPSWGNSSRNCRAGPISARSASWSKPDSPPEPHRR